MLRLIVFVCGAALMSLEIVAARVLAPYLGNSIFVWGAVITTVMVALSLGYWLGGQAADRLGAAAYPRRDRAQRGTATHEAGCSSRFRRERPALLGEPSRGRHPIPRDGSGSHAADV